MFVPFLFQSGSTVFFVLTGSPLDKNVVLGSNVQEIIHIKNNNFLFADRAVTVLRATDPRRLSSIRFSREAWPVPSLSIIKSNKLVSIRY